MKTMHRTDFVKRAAAIMEDAKSSDALNDAVLDVSGAMADLSCRASNNLGIISVLARSTRADNGRPVVLLTIEDGYINRDEIFESFMTVLKAMNDLRAQLVAEFAGVTITEG